MGDDVKITVIATGFVRENLPRIERRAIRTEARAEARNEARTNAVAVPPVELPLDAEPQPEPEIEPQMEPMFAEAPPAEPIPVEALREEPPAAMVAAASGNAANGHADSLFDNLDVPAIMRRSRRLIH